MPNSSCKIKDLLVCDLKLSIVNVNEYTCSISNCPKDEAETAIFATP